MKLPETLRSERGVSPVIGVILMVAITVILAAVIGSFVLGIGGDVEKAPQASLSLEEPGNSGNYQLVHQGGDSIEYNDISTPTGDFSSAHTDSALDPGETWDVDTSSITIVHDPSDNVIAELEA